MWKINTILNVIVGEKYIHFADKDQLYDSQVSATEIVERLYSSYKNCEWNDDFEYIHKIKHPDLGDVDEIVLAYIAEI